MEPNIVRDGLTKHLLKNKVMDLIVIALLISLSAPLLLIPVEKFLPYPYVIEELLKLVIVFLIFKSAKDRKTGLFKWVIFSGLLFTISESIFYLTNIFALGNFSLFPQRIIFTGSLHVGTLLLLYWVIRKNYFWLIGGIAASILIHYFYNLSLTFG